MFDIQTTLRIGCQYSVGASGDPTKYRKSASLHSTVSPSRTLISLYVQMLLYGRAHLPNSADYHNHHRTFCALSDPLATSTPASWARIVSRVKPFEEDSVRG